MLMCVWGLNEYLPDYRDVGPEQGNRGDAENAGNARGQVGQRWLCGCDGACVRCLLAADCANKTEDTSRKHERAKARRDCQRLPAMGGSWQGLPRATGGVAAVLARKSPAHSLNVWRFRRTAHGCNPSRNRQGAVSRGWCEIPISHLSAAGCPSRGYGMREGIPADAGARKDSRTSRLARRR